jgi:hypothetical protein
MCFTVQQSIYIYKNWCVCVCVCVFVCSSIILDRLERFPPNMVHIFLYVCVRILCISIYLSIFYTYKNGCVCVYVCVCVCVCVFEHNSGTPGAISTKLGTYIAICMCKNFMYIFRKEDGVEGREFGRFPLLWKSNYCCC